MVLRGRVLSCPSLLLDKAFFGLLTVEWRLWCYGLGSCCAPSLPLDDAVFSRFNGRVEGMALWGSSTVVPPPSLLTPLHSPVLNLKSGGKGPTGSGTVVSPPSIAILLFSPALTRE